MRPKRKADRHGGPIEEHPEVGYGKTYRLLKSELVRCGKRKRRMLTLERVEDGHTFTMRCDNFCLEGKRPLERFVRQLDVIRSGEFSLVNAEDGELGQGSNKNIQLVRVRDGHRFTMRCDSFCLQGKRPSENFVYQLDVVRSGEFSLVNAEDGELSQGSGKSIHLVRARDGHKFTMRCDTFCLLGCRPRDKLVYQFEVIRNGDFTLANESDSQLGQGSEKNIHLVRVHDGCKFTMRCCKFCSRVCYHCQEMSHCTYAPNTCASCWCIKFPAAALAVNPNAGNKTEILVAAMLEAHLGRVRKEHPTRDTKREDVVLLSTKLAVAVDGMHHFADYQYSANGPMQYCAETQLTDTNKVRWWFEDHPGASYVRIGQRRAWNGYPVNALKPISFDFVSAINYVNQNPDLYRGRVVFLEKMDKETQYAEHRRLLDVEGIEHVTLDPRTIDGPCRILEDKRAIFTQ